MTIKNYIPKFIKGFGFIYFLINCIICVVMGIFAIHAYMTANMSPGFVVFLLPLIGIFSGYWMRTGKYGWWRIVIITASLLITMAILFTAIFVAPGMEKHKQNKFETIKKAEVFNYETEKLFDALYVNDLETVRHQLNKGVNANVKNDTGQTPLHATQDPAILKVLILSGADVNSTDDDGKTPIFNKEIELIKILIEAGADIHQRSNKGNTLIIWYSYSGYLEGIQYVITLGADVNVINKDGQTAYDIAERFAHFELLEYLKSIGAQPGDKRPN